LQIFAFIGILESFSYEKIYYGDSAPGDLGFDPLGVSDDASRAKHYAVRPAPPVTVSRLVDSAEAVLTGAASLQRAEVMNGRLAMIGFSGMLHHALITHKGPIDQIMSADFVRTPSPCPFFLPDTVLPPLLPILQA
jgi:hypothetical protein